MRLSNLVAAYGIALAAPEPHYVVRGNPEWAFMVMGYSECIDSFFAFGLFESASAPDSWIAFRLIGARIDLASVIAIESLVCAARSAAVFIPNALGVQEAADAVLAPLFGVGAELGLAVSLLKRARDIALGVPVLLIWQAVEGQRVLSRPRSRNHRTASANASRGGRH